MHCDERLPTAHVHFLHDEGGASLSEYILIASLVAVFWAIAMLALEKST